MELVLTVLGLLAAVYAVIPRERQLDLGLRIGVLDRLVVFFGFLVVFYLEFYDFFEARSWVLTKWVWLEGITPKNATYLVVLVVAAYLALRIRFSRLTKRKIYRFRELVEELYWAESYGELFSLIQKHLRALFRIYSSEFVLSRLRSRLDPLTWPRVEYEMLKELESLELSVDEMKPSKRHLKDRFLSLIRPVIPPVVKLLPKYDKAQQTAKELIRGVFLSPRFLQTLARMRPYLGLEIVRQSKSALERFDFVEQYLKELIRDPQSVLYWEVRNNQNVSGDRYVVPQSNRILHYFFSDITVAYDNHAYKPIGDFLIAHLDELARSHESDPYNRALGDFEEIDAWHSPVFVGTRFFDIMVKEALFQGMEWHMWLYYMPPIVERIVRNYRVVDPLADEGAEFPIRYSRLLYEIFSCMRDWITALENLPPNQPNIVLNSTRTDHENGNIPKSSILALSDCAYFVAVSEHIGDGLKRCLLDLVFEIYFELRSSGKFDNYALVLLTAIAKGKDYRRDIAEYRHLLLQVFSNEKNEYLITHRNEHVSELEEGLRVLR